ncbi:MAG: glycosyltransferase family 2 protein [Candidatus Portnoybacteria bacterium]|nr:glycosyltransferase family 2 protein [Candidatus Portnoybacteria bacterium]
MDKPYLSVIIPAYNEEETISNTLLDIDKYLSKQKFSSEIIVASDGSKDATVEKSRSMQSLIKNLKVIDNKENHGKGWVIRQAMLEAKGQVRLFMDADNATTVDHFDKMKSFFDEGYEVVIGTRDPKDAKGATKAVDQPFLKRTLGNAANLLIQILAVWGIWDTQCGFKAFSSKAAKEIFSRAKIDRWGFDFEALAIARALGYKIGIIPVYWVNNPNSRVKLLGYLRTIRELFLVRWNLATGKYNIKK